MEGYGRKVPLMCANGGVSSSQPLASEAGLEILRMGGNAAGVRALKERIKDGREGT